MKIVIYCSSGVRSFPCWARGCQTFGAQKGWYGQCSMFPIDKGSPQGWGCLQCRSWTHLRPWDTRGVGGSNEHPSSRLLLTQRRNCQRCFVQPRKVRARSVFTSWLRKSALVT